jgi:hypothetical protein
MRAAKWALNDTTEAAHGPLTSTPDGSSATSSGRHRRGRRTALDHMAIRLARQIQKALDKPEIQPAQLARLASSGASLLRAATSAETEHLRSELLRVKLEEMLLAARQPPDGTATLPENLRATIREVYGLVLAPDHQPPDRPSGPAASHQTRAAPITQGRRSDAKQKPAAAPADNALQPRPRPPAGEHTRRCRGPRPSTPQT